jgi:polyisoprenoid-binding protein YceI
MRNASGAALPRTPFAMHARLRLPIHIVVCAAIATTVASSADAQSATLINLADSADMPVRRLELDWPHSAIEFTVPFMGLSTVRGAFGAFEGTMMYDAADITRSSISIVIRASSINTNVAFRDQHLRSPDFFDVEKYPVITFRSERISRTAQGLVIRGPLTIKGTTQVVDIPFDVIHPLSTDAWSNQRAGFRGTLTIKRSAFGVHGTAFWNSEFDPGRMSIGDDVEIALLVSAKVSNVEKWTNASADSLLGRIDAIGASQALAAFRAAATDTVPPARAAARIATLDNVAVKLMQRGRFQDAVLVFSALEALDPKGRARAIAGAGEAHLMLGHRAAALREFERAAQMDTLNPVAFEYLRTLRAPREAPPAR